MATQDSEDSEREHEVAEVLFDLANMFPPAAPTPTKPASRKREHGAITNGQHFSKPPAIPESLGKFAKRCSSHVYIAAFIKHQQEQERATLGTLPASKAEWRVPPDPAAIAAFSAAAAAAAAAAGAGVPALPPFIAAAAAGSHPLQSSPLLVPPGQLSAAPPLTHLPAPPPLAPLLTPPGFFFPPGAAPFPGAPTAPPFVPGAGPTALSIFGPAPFLQAGFPAAALSQLAAADAAVAASLALPIPPVRPAEAPEVKPTVEPAA